MFNSLWMLLWFLPLLQLIIPGKLFYCQVLALKWPTVHEEVEETGLNVWLKSFLSLKCLLFLTFAVRHHCKGSVLRLTLLRTWFYQKKKLYCAVLQLIQPEPQFCSRSSHMLCQSSCSLMCGCVSYRIQIQARAHVCIISTSFHSSPILPSDLQKLDGPLHRLVCVIPTFMFTLCMNYWGLFWVTSISSRMVAYLCPAKLRTICCVAGWWNTTVRCSSPTFFGKSFSAVLS